MEKINAKFAEYLLVPSNGISVGVGRVETLDGVECRPEFQTTWNNGDGTYDDELDAVCRKYYDCGFQSIRSIWYGRLGTVSDYWHLVKLIKI